MPIYVYWGEDDFTLQKAIAKLREEIIDPAWASFNYDKIPPDRADAIATGLGQAMTPPFGAGKRLVWLVDTNLCHASDDSLLAQLDRTLPAISDSSVLLLTTRNKPDGRLKSTKLLQKYADFREFSPIPPWKEDQILQQVEEVARDMKVPLTREGLELLAAAVGNNTRLLHGELEKLRLYAEAVQKRLDGVDVGNIVTANSQNSLKLAQAIRVGDTGRALLVVEDLINRNEPALKIVATLVGQFRTWLWVRLMMDEGVKDKNAIALSAEVGNPNRIYFFEKDVRTLSLRQLEKTLPILLELEASLKQGAEERATLQTKVIELCQILRTSGRQ
jgi:DNA polymerase III subunit delta